MADPAVATVDEVSPLDYAIKAQTHLAQYLMHKYWARKPHNVIAKYIEYYTKPGAVILDPFIGSGVTAYEALRQGRKVIGIDINPIAILISRVTVQPFDLSRLKKAFALLAEKVKKSVDKVYETKCPVHDKSARIEEVVWSRTTSCRLCGREIVLIYAQKGRNYFCMNCGAPVSSDHAFKTEDKVVRLKYSCDSCSEDAGGRKKLHIKEVSKDDIKHFAALEQSKIPYYYPRGIRFIRPQSEAWTL